MGSRPSVVLKLQIQNQLYIIILEQQNYLNCWAIWLDVICMDKHNDMD